MIITIANRCLLIVILSLLQLSGRAQTGPANKPAACLRAVYQLDYKPDSAVTTSKRVQMILRVSNGVSCFRSTGMHIYDSVYVASKELAPMDRLKTALDAPHQAAKNELRYTIIKEPAKNLVSYHDNISTEDHQYHEKSPLLAWRITAVKKTIAGHECQQAYTAFGGRIWEAWFARDVPVSDGPYKFYGLPGLILRVRDTHDNYVFSLLCLDTNPHPFDAAADTGTPLTAKSSAPVIPKDKFLQAKYNDEVTFLDRMMARGNQFPESARQNYLQNLKRRNNPPELK